MPSVLCRVLFAAVKGAHIACIAITASAQPPANSDAQPATEVDPAHVEKIQAGLELFKTQVRGVLIGNCIDCHGGDAVESGFDLATRKGLIRGGSHGAAVIAGKPADSRLLNLLRHSEKPHMPDGGDKLPDVQIAAIARWIELGAPYDKPLVESPRDPDSWTATVVPEKAREYWAFQPLSRHEPPAVKNESWLKNPIDRFVLAELEEKGLTPRAPAERRVLIRRAYFDLIGLPPPPEEVERFVADPDPLAYEKLIDRLLDSPHFGERWARHWLDAARFAESHGFEQDYDRPHAYHYRDFVIRAFNDDMSYDQFVRWQLAGDELEPENPLALMATGFLGAGVFPTQITANEVERTRYDALDDMAATMGTAMLGLSIGCARCHDHKFDPIPQADYYRLISTFTTTVRSNVDVDMEPEKTKALLAAWEKEHAPKAAALAAYEQDVMLREFEKWTDVSPQLDGTWRKATEWIVFDQAEAKSKNGATLTVQDDGSIVASGKNPDSDTYTITTRRLDGLWTHIKTIRLEALPDPALVKDGPGRADNGNFALSRIRLFAEHADGTNRREIKLVNPRASFEQNDGNLAIAASLDDDPTTGWAVDPQFGQPHIAVFDTDEPIELSSLHGLRLVFELAFAVNTKHALGKLRLSCGYWGLTEPLAKDAASRKQSVALALNAIDGYGTAILPVLEEHHKAALLDEFKRQSPRWNELNDEVQKSLKAKPQPNLVKVMICSEGVTPIRHHTQGADFFEQTYFLKRGDCDQKMGVAEQSFLQVLMTAPEAEKHWQLSPPHGSRTSYRRKSLANWITDTEHGGGHLVARVIVNRLWHHHFGRGIVATPNDFGVQGERPTHPELLDWLAQELIRNDWRLKPIHKQIMTSAAYMQSSDFRAADAKLDPENVFLWRFESRRLEAEVIRDSLLAASGTLDRTMYGPGTLDEGHPRRSIYFMVKRSKLVPMMQLFDQPEPLVSVGQRPATTIAPQALALMNSPHIRDYAHRFARRLLPAYEKSPAGAVKQGYLTAIGREPDDSELAAALDFFAAQEQRYAAEKNDPSADSRELALADFCQVLFGLNEFVYVE